MTAIKKLALLALLSATVAAPGGRPLGGRQEPPHSPAKSGEKTWSPGWESRTLCGWTRSSLANGCPCAPSRPTTPRPRPSIPPGSWTTTCKPARRCSSTTPRGKPALLVRGPFGRLLVGTQDGLVKGMRPRLLSGSFQGSCLMEQGPRLGAPGQAGGRQPGRRRRQAGAALAGRGRLPDFRGRTPGGGLSPPAGRRARRG